MILALDTSGRRCGVAIWEFGSARFSESEAALRHNEELLFEIFKMTVGYELKPPELQAVAVSSGPGSFTGLRVGMAVAKGLCWSGQVPLICVPTLEAYAHAMPAESRRVVPLMPARAEEVYWSLYEWEEPDGWSAKTPCRVSPIAALPELLCGRIGLCGEGWERHHRRLTELFGNRLITVSALKGETAVVISVAHLAAARYEGNRFEDLCQAEPNYCYPFFPKPASMTGPGE